MKVFESVLRMIMRPLMALLVMVAAIIIYSGGAGHVRAAVVIDESTFPDPVFRAVISGPDYDRDLNGIIDDAEIALTINIYCEGMGITSIQGVEYFTALQGLWCKDNYISYMDLSNNKDLHGVWCSGNLFTSLDFSANPELEWVYCYDCNLSYLNVSNNPKMAFIECNTNPLPALDVSHNPLLEHLTCGSCLLTSLDLSNNPNLSHLDAFRNRLTYLDVSGCPKMKRLDIWDNPGLGSIDVSHNPGLQYYNCANNDVYTINVSNNPELQKLICSYNHITSLDVTHNPKLFYLDCACNLIGALDLSGNPSLHFLQAFTNSFTSLDIGANPLLVKTYNEGVKQSEYDVCVGHSWTLDYGGDTSTGGDNLYFLCFDDAVTLSAGNSSASASAQTATAAQTASGDQISREAAAWILYSIAGSPAVSGSSRFSDVAHGAWYENALIWGEKNSICLGYPDVSSDTFGVGRVLTRQDMALMLMRYSEVMDYKRAIDFGRSDDFKDYYDIDQYAWEAITWAITWNLMDGKGTPGVPKSELLIDPHGSVTYTEFQDMFNRMMEANGLSRRASFPVPDVTAVSVQAQDASAGAEVSGVTDASDVSDVSDGSNTAASDNGNNANVAADAASSNSGGAASAVADTASEGASADAGTASADGASPDNAGGTGAVQAGKDKSVFPYIMIMIILCIAVGFCVWFFTKKKYEKKDDDLKYAYDPEKEKPIIRASICNGEQVAGFKNKETGEFHEVMMIKDQGELNEFMKTYGLDHVDKEY